MSEVCGQYDVSDQVQHCGVILARQVLKNIAAVSVHYTHCLGKMMSLKLQKYSAS